MRRTVWLTIVFLLSGFAPLKPGWGQGANARQQIEKVIRRSENSLAKKDTKAYMVSFADDYQGQDITGNVYDKTQAQKNLTESFSNARSLRSRTQVQKVTLVNNEATVWSKEHTELSSSK